MPRHTRPRARELPRSRPLPPLPVGDFRPEASATHSVFRRLAIHDEAGRIAKCWPTLDEQRDGAVPQRKGRVGYRTKADARAAAAELARIEGTEVRPAVQCRCTRMMGGAHYHLVLPISA